VCLLTKSALVVRDIDIFKRMPDVDVGLTITTDREDMRQIFEPGSSTIAARLSALKELKEQGIPTHVFIGPILPMNPAKLIEAIAPYTARVLVDKMNYPWKAREAYVKHNLKWALDPAYFEEIEADLARRLAALGIDAEVV
jgi:DNA repair photolyase